MSGLLWVVLLLCLTGAAGYHWCRTENPLLLGGIVALTLVGVAAFVPFWLLFVLLNLIAFLARAIIAAVEETPA